MRMPLLGSGCLVVGVLAACGDDGVTIVVNVTAPPMTIVGPSARLAVALYGYDTTLADASADRLLTHIDSVDRLPLVLELTLPADAAAQIDQGGGPVPRSEARFYLGQVVIDLDGDGLICDGDLDRGVPVTGLASFDADGPRAAFAVTMSVHDTGVCAVLGQ